MILDDADEPMDYAPGLAAVRRHLGLSVSAVAEATGVSPRTVENWEQGRNMPPANALFALGGLLKRRSSGRVGASITLPRR